MNRTLFSILKFLIGWPISALAIFFIVKIFLPQYQLIFTNSKNPNIFLLTLGIICFVLFYFLRSFLWKMMLFGKGYDIPFKEAAFLWGASELKRFVPGNIWSFLGKGIAFSQKGVKGNIITHLLLIEAEFFVIGCMIVSLFSFPLLFQNNLDFLSLTLILTVIFVSILFIFNRSLIKNLNLPFLSAVLNFLPDYQVGTNLKLLSISIISLVLFGLGTYFAIISITYLNAVLLLSFIGFFVLSLLLGYLSFITPMGLGVREGVVIWGLSKAMNIQMAGFSAIYSRAILIIAELIFLILSFIWRNAKNKFIIKIESFIKNHSHGVMLGLLIFLYIFYFTTASFQRHDNFYTGRFDLGNMDQTVWNTIHGRIFEFTDPNGTENISRLAFHADFILILLSPLYLIWSDPKMLLLVQSIVLGFGGFFVYKLGKKILKNKNLSLALSFAFLINPLINYVNLYDFHPVALATTFLLGAFYFLKTKKYMWFIIFLLLASITKEQVWVIAGLFGIYILFTEKKKLLGAGIFAISVIVFYYLISYAIPQAKGGGHFALSYYSDFGESPATIIKNILFSPLKTLAVILKEKQLLYLFNNFFPLGFLSVLSPLTLIFAIPDLLINLLSNNPQLHQIYYQYSATITPFIFISTIYAIYNLKKWIPKISNTIYIYYIIFFTILSAYLIGPLPGSLNPNINMFIKQYPDKELVDRILLSIPKNLSVAATNNLGAHLSQREKIYTVPGGLEEADVVLFLLNDLYAQPSLEAQVQMAEKMKKDKNYIKIFEKGEFIAFKKI